MWVLYYWRGRIMDLKYQPIPSPRVSFHLSTLRLMPQQQVWPVLTLQEEGRQRDAARAKVSSLFGFILGASLVVQWLRIHLPLQGTWARSLVQEQRSHVSRVTKPMPTTTTETCTPWSPVHSKRHRRHGRLHPQLDTVPMLQQRGSTDCRCEKEKKENKPIKNKIRDSFQIGVFHKTRASQVVRVVKNPSANAGDRRDTTSIPGLGRAPGGGHGNPLQCSCLENPMDRGAWWVTVHRFAKSRTQLKQLSI